MRTFAEAVSSFGATLKPKLSNAAIAGAASLITADKIVLHAVYPRQLA